MRRLTAHVVESAVSLRDVRIFGPFPTELQREVRGSENPSPFASGQEGLGQQLEPTTLGALLLRVAAYRGRRPAPLNAALPASYLVIL